MDLVPPEPSRSYTFKFPDEVLREVIYSSDGRARAFISEMKSGSVRLRIELWMYHDHAGKEEWFWRSVDSRAHALDSIARAKELALFRFERGLDEERG